VIKQSVLRGVDRAFTLYSYNPPKSANNWVNAEALKPVPGRLVHSSCYLDVPPEWLGTAFIDEAERLRVTNERAYRNEYLGEVTGTGGQVFDNLTIRTIPDEEIETFGTTYAGLDFGWFPDPAHFVRCAFAPATRKLWIYDEYRTVKTSNRDIFEYLTKNKGLTYGEEVIADSAELKSVADMRSFGMRCVGATKGPGSVRTGIRWLQTLAEIIIDPARCPETAKEFAQYEYEKDRDGNPVEAYPDEQNHSIDAVRYALNRIWQRRGM
jgi:phage terminase large subunit